MGFLPSCGKEGGAVMDTSVDQAQYWNALADTYRAITRIDANDFHYGPMLDGESQLRLLPKLEPGMRALELGCGEGQNSIWLAKQGVQCTAIDVSEGQLGYARKDALAAGVEIDFRCLSIEAFEAEAESYDLITSSHAFEFLSDPFVVVERVASWLRKGGTFMMSTVHPVFNGEWVFMEDAEGQEVCGRFLRNYFLPIDDVREQLTPGGSPVASRAWPVSLWFNSFRRAGLRIVRLEEPMPALSPAYESDAWREAFDELSAIPSTLILVAEKV